MVSYEKRKSMFLKKLKVIGLFDLVGEYVDSRTKSLFKCKKCGYEFTMIPSRVLCKNFCHNCNGFHGVHDFSKKEQAFRNKLENLGKFNLIGEYLGAHGGKMLFECLKCGAKFKRDGSQILRSKNCPRCAEIARCSIDINESISVTHPDLAKCLLYKKDGETHTRHSAKILWWKCPECGVKVKRSPDSFLDKFVCKFCSDGISYPNKFFASFLKEAGIVYTPEKVFDWSKFDKNHHFRYDFYIESKNIIVEVMGGQHYEENNGWYGSGNSTKEVDIEKEMLARLHGIVNYIKIDCRISEPSFIKESIIKEMKEFYNLKDLNWKRIESNSLKSKVIEVCECYNSNPNINIFKLGELFDVNRNVISKYLRLGSSVGLCNYSQEYPIANKIIHQAKGLKKDLQQDIILVSNYFNKHTEKNISELSEEFRMNEDKIIFCLLKGNNLKLCVFPKYEHFNKGILQFNKYGEFISSFASPEIAAKYFNVHESTINRACRGNILMCHSYVFRNNISNITTRNKEVSQYTLDGKFIKTFNSIKEAVMKTEISSIYSNLKGITKTAGGYVWKYKD